MNLQTVILRAANKAKSAKDWRYIVLDIDDEGCRGYCIASEYELDTYYSGAQVIVAVGPHGEVEKD